MANIYAVKTTVGQERNVAEMISMRADKEKYGVYTVLVSNEIKGYILAEAENKSEVDKSLRGVGHARGVVPGEIPFSEVEKFLAPKPAVSKVEQGDVVELISGPFKGEKARVVRVDQKKEKITVELFEATVPIPVTVDGESIKVIRKEEVSEDEGGD